MPLDPHGFINMGADGGLKQQAIGLIRPGMTKVLIGSKVGIKLVQVARTQGLIAIPTSGQDAQITHL